jgi:hypothetical protein
MARYTRGEFLGFSAALAGAFTLGRWPRGGRRMPSLEQAALAQGAAAQMTVGEPDLVVVNARVFTSDTASCRR